MIRTAEHVVEERSAHRFQRGLKSLHAPERGAVRWMTESEKEVYTYLIYRVRLFVRY